MSSARLGRLVTLDARGSKDPTEDREVEEGEEEEELRLDEDVDEDVDEEHDGVPMSMLCQLCPSNGAATGAEALNASLADVCSMTGRASIRRSLVAGWRQRRGGEGGQSQLNVEVEEWTEIDASRTRQSSTGPALQGLGHQQRRFHLSHSSRSAIETLGRRGITSQYTLTCLLDSSRLCPHVLPVGIHSHQRYRLLVRGTTPLACPRYAVAPLDRTLT